MIPKVKAGFMCQCWSLFRSTFAVLFPKWSRLRGSPAVTAVLWARLLVVQIEVEVFCLAAALWELAGSWTKSCFLAARCSTWWELGYEQGVHQSVLLTLTSDHVKICFCSMWQHCKGSCSAKESSVLPKWDYLSTKTEKREGLWRTPG